MKAIVMAGGEGTRLRPLTADMPKPMAPIMGRSVLEHMLRLLKKNGVDQVLITLGYMAAGVESWAAAGPIDGLEITCRREDTPLGTAGSVRAAADWLDGEDFLVVSGDAVCDFDLASCAAFRRDKHADAVLVLSATEEPGEYGSVITDADGRITGFLEKPRSDKVATDYINTGVYALSPSVLELICEDGPCDFGRDVFPRMLSEGRRLYGLRAAGYWCDIGSIPAYLRCCRDALEGRIDLDPAAPLVRKGLWCAGELPEKVTILPPVYIGKDCAIEPGAVLGPAAILEDGSSAASGARVTNSVVMGAALRRGALVGGSWLGRGAVIGERAIVSDGCAVGSGAVAGACSMLEEGTRLWPKRDVPPGEQVSGSFEDRPVRGPLRFSSGGVIRGEWNAQITPESCFALGCASSRWGRVGISCGAGPVAQLVMSSLQCGVRAGGGSVVESDADHEWACAMTARRMELPLAIFVRESAGQVTLSFYGVTGRPVTREEERRLESGASGSLRIAPAEKTGGLIRTEGAAGALALDAAKRMKNHGVCVWVEGTGAEARLLYRALELAGITPKGGGVMLRPEEGGFTLTGRDETGRDIFARDSLMLSLMSCLESGQRQLTLPEWAPHAAVTLAEKYGARVTVEGRESETAPPPPGALDMAADIIAALGRGERLSDMLRGLPPYAVAECEVPVRFGAAVLRRLREQCRDMDSDTTDGLELSKEGRYARLRKSADSLRISAEASDMEAAQELCFRLRDLARASDRI